MTTALTIIQDALSEIGVIGAGDTASAEDAALCLRKLNQVLQRWSNSPLMFPALTEITVPLDGSASYTIGPTGDVVTTRPISVRSVTYVDAAGLESPVTNTTQEEWGAISNKNVSASPPDTVWYEGTVTDGTLHVYPKADTGSLVLDCTALLSSFPALTTTVTLPEGYESALTLTLAQDVTRIFGKPLTQDLAAAARGARSLVKRTNTAPLYMQIDGGGQSYQIERGY